LTLSQLDSALAEWTTLLESHSVITEQLQLRAAETATFATTQKIPAILRPSSREQVQECLRIAQRFGVPVYPISSGKNWGYGSRVPVTDSCVLLDLGRMDRIVDFSEELAYVTVEPGVTQGQLFEFLRARKSRLWLDATGTSPSASLIGNTVERGFGHTPYGDHFAHVCGLEVVLPNGEVLETGFSRFAGAKAGPLNRWGVGPTLDGLFSQSNLGIVTRMSIWLMPAPEYFQAYFFRCDGEGSLGPLVDALRPLRLNNTIRSTVHIGNDYKVLSGIQQYPWKETGGRIPLIEGTMADLRKKLHFGRWNGSGGLYGTRKQVAEARRLIRRALAGRVNKLQFLDDRLLELAGRFAKPYQWATGWDISRTLELVRPVYGLMKGIPTSEPLASTYWRKRTPPPADMNPDRDGCGLLWCSPISPTDGHHAEELTRLACETLLGHGFEPMISLSMVSERTLACVVSIGYDRDEPDEDEKAMTCYKDLLARLAASGYHSYRLTTRSMDALAGDNGYNRLLASIKRCVDPKNILAPGRYQAY